MQHLNISRPWKIPSKRGEKQINNFVLLAMILKFRVATMTNYVTKISVCYTRYSDFNNPHRYSKLRPCSNPHRCTNNQWECIHRNHHTMHHLHHLLWVLIHLARFHHLQMAPLQLHPCRVSSIPMSVVSVVFWKWVGRDATWKVFNHCGNLSLAPLVCFIPLRPIKSHQSGFRQRLGSGLDLLAQPELGSKPSTGYRIALRCFTESSLRLLMYSTMYWLVMRRCVGVCVSDDTHSVRLLFRSPIFGRGLHYVVVLFLKMFSYHASTSGALQHTFYLRG